MPGPIHGASIVGKYIHESKLINSEFDCQYINLATAKKLNDIGKFKIRKIGYYLRLVFNVYNVIKSFEPDLVYVTPNSRGGAFYKDFFVIQIIKLLKKKIIVHYHNKGVAKSQNNLINNIFYKIFFHKIRVILLSKLLYQDVSKYVKEDDVYYCPNGIPNIDYHIDKNIDDENSSEYRFIYLSNMLKAKGVFTLIKACAKLKNNGGKFSCTFVGGWKDITETAFYRVIKKLEIDNGIKVKGPLYYDNKRQELKNADCLVLPSYNECFPLVLLEAMKKGLPCISTNVGGIPSIVKDGVTGFIVPAGDVDALVEKMKWIMDNPEEAKVMGEKGREKFLNEYTLDIFERRMRDILKDSLN